MIKKTLVRTDGLAFRLVWSFRRP